MKHTAFHWPDRVIGKRESRRIRDAHNALFNSHAELLRALVELQRELWAAGLTMDVKKHFSLLAADAQAGTAIHNAK